MKLRLQYILLLKFLIPAFIISQNLFNEEPIVRVRIIYTLDSMTIIFSDSWDLSDSPGIRSHQVTDSDSLLFTAENNHIVIRDNRTNSKFILNKVTLRSHKPGSGLKIKNVPYGIGWWWEGVEDRIYEGEIEISVNQSGKLDVIVQLPLEKYLCGVVPYEIGNDAPLEALKAQVIAARSETVEALITGKYKSDNYDLCADVECQVFAGNKKRTVLTDKAVAETKGLCLLYGDEVIGAYYASNCGGISENVENVWPDRSEAVPYWSSQFDSDIKLDYAPKHSPEEWIESNPDVFCNPYFHPELPEWSKRNFRWEVEMTPEELSKNLNELKYIGKLKDIIPVERGNSGRIIKALFIGEIDTLELNSELSIRKIRKPPFRSSCFVFGKLNDGQSDQKFIFRGAGWGHGVGMCQSGAVSRAISGQDYITILKHYFPGTEIKKVF